MEELGYSDVSQLPQLELITWDTSEQKLLLETIIDQWKQNLGLENIQLTQYVIGTAIGSFYDLSYDLFAITWETDVAAHRHYGGHGHWRRGQLRHLERCPV